MTRVAIFGSGGQLGIELNSELRRRGYESIAFARADVDITDAVQVERSLHVGRPSIVINAAAYNQVDLAEQEPVVAFLVNALAVRLIAMACHNQRARFVHFSTDYVFDGAARRPYSEEDPTGPLGAYAVSKLAGELYARA